MSSTTPPRVFVGSAFGRDLSDMAATTATWPTVAARAGYMAHPMGSKAIGPSVERRLIASFASGWFYQVVNLGGVERGRDPLRDYRVTAAAAPSWFRCAGLLVYVSWGYLARPKDYVNMVSQFRKVIDAAKPLGLPLFPFVTPLARDDSDQDYVRFLQSPDWWLRLVQDTQADGIAIDFPHLQWLLFDKPPWRVERWRKVADDMARGLQTHGKKLVWSLNGTVKDTAQIDEFVGKLRARGTVPDVWLVDHFNRPSQDQAGTPETGDTTTGGARTLLKYV